MSLFRYLPRSFGFFIATAVLMALQWFPITGIFLMIMLAMFWSIALINAGFIGIAIEALLGKTHPLWLLAPLVWYGGYGYAAWQSHRAMDAIDAQIAQTNAGKQLAFDPARQSLVVLQGNDTGGMAGALVRGYDLPVAYEPNKNFPGVKHLAHRMGAGELCDRIRTDKRYGAAFIHVMGFHEGPDWRHQTFIKGMCVISLPQDPALPVVTVSATHNMQNRDYLELAVYAIALRDDRGGAVDLMAARAAPLAWFPQPIMGCALNSGAPSWSCFGLFRRDGSNWLGVSGADGLTKLVAARLGLTASPASSRRDKIAAQPDPGFGAAIEKRENASLATFNAALADPTKPAGYHDLKGLVENTSLYADRAGDIVESIRQRFAQPHPIAEHIKNLETLLAALPDDRFRAIAPAMLDILRKAGEVSVHNTSDALAYRLADLGTVSLPVLERLAFEKPVKWASSPIQALCRVGAPAAHHADRIAERLYSSRRSDDTHMAAYIALLRFGRRDLLANEPDTDSRYRRSEYDYWAQTITPDSPPDVCQARRAPRS